MEHPKIKTFGELKKSGYKNRSVKQEIRDNLILSIQQKQNPFHGILGYEDTV
jgi:magnesium chelatase subunit I